jgi:hypothetical protein
VALALTIVVLTAPLLDWRSRTRTAARYVLATAVIALLIAVARLLLSAASPADWSRAGIFSSVPYASTLLNPLFKSPFDLLLTAGTGAALVALLLSAIEGARAHVWRYRRSAAGLRHRAAFLAEQVAAGVIAAIVLLAHQWFLRDTVTQTTLDLLHLSLHPWTATRLTLQLGIILADAAALGLTVVVLRGALVGWRVPRRAWGVRLMTVAAWTLPLVIWQLTRGSPIGPQLPILAAIAASVMLAGAITRLSAQYRRGSQAFRLTLLLLPLLVPAFAFYPTIVQFARQAKADLVVSRWAREVIDLRTEVQRQAKISREEIDAIPGLVDLVSTRVVPGTEDLTDRAFRIWQQTALGRYPITSSIELYGPDRRLVSRFAFHLPEDLSATALSEEQSCDWDVVEEVAPFFAEERRVLHSGRAFCAANPAAPPVGSIVVHAMPD